MPKKSKIEKLPQETQDILHALRAKGHTIDAIHAKLMEMDVEIARSTVARHISKIDKIGEQLRQTRIIADALVAKFGERTDNRMLQLNIELMMPAIMNLLTAEEGQDVVIDAKDAMFLATALEKVSKAQAADTARQLKERTEFAKEAAKNVEKVSQQRGLTPETVTAIKAAILGVDIPEAKAPPAP